MYVRLEKQPLSKTTGDVFCVPGAAGYSCETGAPHTDACSSKTNQHNTQIQEGQGHSSSGDRGLAGPQPQRGVQPHQTPGSLEETTVKLSFAKGRGITRLEKFGNGALTKEHTCEETKSSESLAPLEKEARGQAGRASRRWLRRAPNAECRAGSWNSLRRRGTTQDVRTEEGYSCCFLFVFVLKGSCFGGYDGREGTEQRWGMGKASSKSCVPSSSGLPPSFYLLLLHSALLFATRLPRGLFLR